MSNDLVKSGPFSQKLTDSFESHLLAEVDRSSESMVSAVSAPAAQQFQQKPPILNELQQPASFGQIPKVNPYPNAQVNLTQSCDDYFDPSDGSVKSSITEKSQLREQLPIESDIFVVLLGPKNTGKTIFANSFPPKQFHKLNTPKSSSRLVWSDDRVRLHVIDLPGFSQNESVNHYENRVSKVVEQFTEKQKQHLCGLYFLAGPLLNDYDQRLLSLLSISIKLIPVVAKSDTYTLRELTKLSSSVMELKLPFVNWYEMVNNGLKAESYLIKRIFPDVLPFLVAGAASQERDRVREWGAFQFANPKHSEVTLLRHLLLDNAKLSPFVKGGLVYSTPQKRTPQYWIFPFLALTMWLLPAILS